MGAVNLVSYLDLERDGQLSSDPCYPGSMIFERAFEQGTRPKVFDTTFFFSFSFFLFLLYCIWHIWCLAGGGF
jgi:hypothetical protein